MADLIPARKFFGVEWVSRQYGRWLFRRSFHQLWVEEQEPLAPAGPPLLFLANHSSWWDGPAMMHLNGSYLHHDLFVWMSAAGLTRFPIFARMGAFGVRQNSPTAAKAGLAYARGLLESGQSSPRRSLWLFPQGEEQPLERRPLTFGGGAAGWLATAAAAPVETRPVAFYYRVGHYKLPELFVAIGAPAPVAGLERKAANRLLEERLTALLNDVRERVAAAPVDQVPGFAPWGG